MDGAPTRKPCCVCAAPGAKHCTKCKSRHYCSKKCQLLDWNEGGHKAQCKQLAADFQDQLLDELMPAKKVKEEPAIVADVAPAAGLKAAARLPAVRTAKTTKTGAPSDGAPSWRGTCPICLDVLPVEGAKQTFYDCCCKRICTACSDKCRQHDDRCPLCRSAPSKSAAEWMRRLQKHLDKGNAEAQIKLGNEYRDGGSGIQQSFKRSFELYELAAAQGHAIAQTILGIYYARGNGVEIDHKTAAQWYRRAAEQGYPAAQYILGKMFDDGQGVAQSYDEAVRWYRLAAAQGFLDALYNLAACYGNGQGVPQDACEALRLCKLAAANGHAEAAATVKALSARASG